MSDSAASRSAGGRSWDRIVSMSPRRAVSGVRISWEASAAKRRCSDRVVRRRRCASSRRPSMRLIARDSRPTSSGRPSGTRTEGSWLVATDSAACCVRVSGRRALRTMTSASPVASSAAATAATTSPRATSSRVCSTSVRGRATATVRRLPSEPVGSARTSSR